MVKSAEDIGLTLNLLKCEIITQDHTTFDTILTSIPGAQRVQPAYATLLGSPLGDGSCISRAIAEKIDALKRVGEKFEVLSAHDVAPELLFHPKAPVSAADSPLFQVGDAD